MLTRLWRQLYSSFSRKVSRYPVFIIAGDFNHVDLKAVLPKFHQHVKCDTRGFNTLDKVDCNIKLGYRAKQLPHLTQCDYMLLIIPTYTELWQLALMIPFLQLQGCWKRTNWGISEYTDLELFTGRVQCNIKTCTTLLLWKKASGFSPTRNPGWPGRSSRCLKRGTWYSFTLPEIIHHSPPPPKKMFQKTVHSCSSLPSKVGDMMGWYDVTYSTTHVMVFLSAILHRPEPPLSELANNTGHGYRLQNGATTSSTWHHAVYQEWMTHRFCDPHH